MGVESQVKKLAHEAGFALVRIGSAGELHLERARYLDWIAGGRAADMRWIDVTWARKASSPQSAVPDARSVISVALPYWAGKRPRVPGHGKIARYAWGRDYHRVLGEMLDQLAQRLRAEFGGEHRWYVDTGPAMDKALAARSGVGWYGKNTNILTEQFGSFVLLGEVITTLALAPDAPLIKDCGQCRLCIRACPTGALGPDYTIDSRKCISYLTIEHRGSIPRELRAAVGDWVFGCDICQDVCPPTMLQFLENPKERREWARQVRGAVVHENENGVAPGEEPGSTSESIAEHALFDVPIRASVDLFWLLELNHEDYLEAFRGSAIRRAKVWMLRRNAAIALGNVGDACAIEPLSRAMAADAHPVVRGHAAWALGEISRRLSSDNARSLILSALNTETDPEVRLEMATAVERAAPSKTAVS